MLSPEEKSVIKDIEKLIGRPITETYSLGFYSYGYEVEGQNIVKLGLYNCKLKILPESIGNLKFLKDLELEKNNLKSLPASLNYLNSLQYLNLKENKFHSFPDQIIDLKSIQVLNFSRNFLKIIPSSIKELHNLQDLNLFHNKLKILPESIGNLKQLKRLNILKNNIDALPSTFNNLISLEVLYMPFKLFHSVSSYFRSIKSNYYKKIIEDNEGDGDIEDIGDGSIFDSPQEPPWF